MGTLRRDLMLQVFLHANRELDDFQRSVITKVLGPDATKESIQDAIVEITQKHRLLNAAGWSPKKTATDQVLRPDHYDRFPIEPTYLIVESGGFHWCLENFLKYIVRFRFKNGTEDLGKALRNLGMYLRYLAGEKDWSR